MATRGPAEVGWLGCLGAAFWAAWAIWAPPPPMDKCAKSTGLGFGQRLKLCERPHFVAERPPPTSHLTRALGEQS